MAAEAGADVIVTACPFCLVNMEDAIKVAGLEGTDGGHRFGRTGRSGSSPDAKDPLSTLPLKGDPTVH
jgi:Fe-S oxidoreductase